MTGSHVNALRRLALTLLGGALVVFHGRLLWQHWTDGSFSDPSVFARWAASGLLIAGLAWVYRHRGSLFRGREAAVLWTLVLLLHALAGVPASDMLTTSAPWVALPLVALALGAITVALGASRSKRLPSGDGHDYPPITRSWSSTAGHAGVLGSRAPPR